MSEDRAADRHDAVPVKRLSLLTSAQDQLGLGWDKRLADTNERIFLGLGANVGQRQDYLLRALEELGRLGQIEQVSSLYETEPWGGVDQSDLSEYRDRA